MRVEISMQNVANLVCKRKGTISGSEGSIDVTGLPSGVYTFSTAMDGKPCVAKLTKYAGAVRRVRH